MATKDEKPGLLSKVAMFVRNPFDVVKQQLQGNMHPSTRAAIAKILRAEGLRGSVPQYSRFTRCANYSFSFSALFTDSAAELSFPAFFF